VDADSVFHFHFAQIVQLRLPMSVLLEIFGHTLRQQDVSGIPAIHYSLGDIDSDAGGVRAVVQIRHRADWPAMHTHAHPQFRIRF